MFASAFGWEVVGNSNRLGCRRRVKVRKSPPACGRNGTPGHGSGGSAMIMSARQRRIRAGLNTG